MPHLPPKKSGRRLNQLSFHFPHTGRFALPQQNHRANHVSLTVNRADCFADIFLHAFWRDLHKCAVSTCRKYNLAAFDLLLHFPAQRFSNQISAASCRRDKLIPIRNQNRMPGDLCKAFCILPGKGRHFPDRRIFFQDDFSLPVGEDFQRIRFPNPQRSANFLRDYDASEVINPTDNSCCFHIKKFLLLPTYFP